MPFHGNTVRFLQGFLSRCICHADSCLFTSMVLPVSSAPTTRYAEAGGCLAVGRVPIHSSKRLADASIANRTGNTLPPQILRSSAKNQAHLPSPSPNTFRYTSSSPWPGAYFSISSGTGAASTILPARSKITLVATVSTSETTCVATRMIRSLAISASSSRRRTRSLGSRPAVGSSKNQQLRISKQSGCQTAGAASYRRNKQKGACPTRRLKFTAAATRSTSAATAFRGISFKAAM